MIVKGDAKKYLGAITSESKAAILYDKYALIIQGLEVRISFTIFNRLKQTSPTPRGKLKS